MAPMDISDVAYDTFMINGRRTSTIEGKPGEKVRLRLINAGASTYFYIDSATGPMTIVAADGPDIEPVEVNRFLIGIAETYDVIVTIPDSGSYEIRATAQDGSGYASTYIGEGPQVHAKSPPKENIYDMDSMMEMALMDGDTSHLDRPLPPYKLLKSPVPTDFPADLLVREIELRLTGDMNRYIWSFNGKTLAEDSTIKIKRGEVLRLKLINDTMMHHPLHLHGHFFRVLNGSGKYSPLKHTVDVHPMGRQTIEFNANESGDWFFHCHILYHMDAGMARVFSYEEQGADHTPNIDPKLINPAFFMGEISAQSHMAMGHLKVMKGRNDYVVRGHAAYGDHDEYEVDVNWERYLNPDWTTFLGYRFTDIMDTRDRAIAGFRYRLPLLFQSEVLIDSEGDARFGLGKEFELYDRLSLSFDIEYDTNTYQENSVDLQYLLTKDFSLILENHSDHGFGGGLIYRF